MRLLRKAGAIERVEIDGATYLLRVPDDYLRDEIDGAVSDQLGPLPSASDIGRCYMAGLRKYRLQGDGYIVYSVGRNGEDDGGVKDEEGDRDDIVVEAK